MHRLMPPYPSEVHVNGISFAKPSWRRSGACSVPPSTATCTSPRKHSPGFAVAGVMVCLPCPKRADVFFTLASLPVGHRKMPWWERERGKKELQFMAWGSSPAERPLVRLAASSCFPRALKSHMTTARDRTFHRPSDSHYNLYFPRAAILKRL